MECRCISQAKKTELAHTLTSQNIDVFTIMEANLTHDDLSYYHFNGYTLHLLQKFRQIASGILDGIRDNVKIILLYVYYLTFIM